MSTWLTDHKVELLRFSTCGSVDDGKSTLDGRLLYDSKSLFQDQLDALEKTREFLGDQTVNLANLTDGLREEREQGITIDVAYRFVATPRRKFIVADTPGHVQYTRNMVTGMSTANLAVILIDARHGVIEQTRRHAYIASLLGTPHIVVCVNKMDLVDYSQDVFEAIREDFDNFATRLQTQDIRFIPMSALNGDNVVDKSDKMPWYDGPALLSFMEKLHIANDGNLNDQRFPVQWVVRPQTEEHHDFRGYAGQVAGGVFRPGDDIVVLPSGVRSKVASIHLHDQELDEAFAPQSVTIQLQDDVDISRGDLLVGPDSAPYVSAEVTAMVCWLHEKPLRVGGRYRLMQNSNETRAIVRELEYCVNVNTLQEDDDSDSLRLNEVGRLVIKTQKPLCYDEYRRNRVTGSFILIDESTNATVAAGMLLRPPIPPPPVEFADYAI